MFKPSKYIFIILCALFCCMFTSAEIKAQNTERILNYHSDIKVDTTGRVLVTEDIRINVTGESIGRGIVRTLPIYRTDIYGSNKRIDLTILSIQRDGEGEEYSTKIVNNDLAIYIGNEKHYLIPKVYNYTIQYESYGHVGFFDNYDEIYWNVTGNDWAFPIDSASATVRVPEGTKVISNACYTGVRGAKSTNCNYIVEGDSIVNYTCANDLTEGEGFTVATSFTPFIIKRPAPPTKYEIFLNTYYYPIMLFCGFGTFMGYLLFILKKYDTRNKRILVVPTFNPPDGKSAASIRYLFKKGVDPKSITASLLSMAVKNAIFIDNTEWNYIITKKDKPSDLSEEENRIYDILFNDGNSKSILLENTYNSLWSSAYDRCRSILEKKDKLKNYFLDKKKFFKINLSISIVLVILWLVAAFYMGRIDEERIAILGIVTVASIVIARMCYLSYKSGVIFIFLFVFGIPLIITQCVLIGLPDTIYRYTIGFIYGLILLNFLFIKFFSLETKKGLQFIAELEGFKMYLKTAEENRLNVLTPPDRTPEQFEKMLPYAVALDLEIEWANKFSKILKQYDYQPTWYLGPPIVSYTDFSRSLSRALTSRVDETTLSSFRNSSGASSGGSRSSGSRSWSSGSRGGGSSGGGGGGGGGRGW